MGNTELPTCSLHALVKALFSLEIKSRLKVMKFRLLTPNSLCYVKICNVSEIIDFVACVADTFN
jgi:hypothetical protein